MSKKQLKKGFGSITELKGKKKKKPYRASKINGYNENGVATRKIIGYYETYEEAMEALIAYNNSPFDLNLKDITLAQLYERWKVNHFSRVGEHSQKKYSIIFNKHLKPLHDFKMREIRVDEILSIMENKTKAIQTDIKVLMVMLFKWADKRDLVAKNYASMVSVGEVDIAKGKETERTVFEKEEIEELWDNLEKPCVDIALILLYTGMRINELLKMESKNVHLDENYMIGGSKGKKDKNGVIQNDRIIPIHPKIKPLIEERLKDRKKYLITTPFGNAMSYSNLVKSYWFEITDHYCHDTRHTFITQMRKCGADIIWLKKIVGHSDNTMTDKYTHKSPEVLFKEIIKLQY